MSDAGTYRSWSLRTANGCLAALVHRAEHRAVRVAIERANPGDEWDIQINWPQLHLQEQQDYVLTVALRADAPRQVSFGVAMDRAPWSNLGLYHRAEITSAWQTFELAFAVSSDGPARVHFDLGGSATSVEIAEIALHQSDGAPITSQWTEPETNLVRASERPKRGPGLPAPALILMYHRVAEESIDPWSICVSPKHFDEQMRVLRRVADTSPLASLAPPSCLGQRPSVAITFDDGYVDNLQHAKPVLERHDVPATVFVATAYVGGTRQFWWDELESLLLRRASLPDTLNLPIAGNTHTWRLEANPARFAPPTATDQQRWTADDPPLSSRHVVFMDVWRLLQLVSEAEQRAALRVIADWSGGHPVTTPVNSRGLTDAELRELDRCQLIEIGAHTVSHPALTSVAPDQQQHEIVQSRNDLERLLGHSVSSFCYPYGDYSDELMATVKRAGFSRACTTSPDVLGQETDPYSLPRFHVKDWSGDEFASHLQQWIG